jgi:hypothetical protein
MATRLEITHGLIAERDRVSTSGDTLSVTRPTTGSKTRTKGVLFIVVGSTMTGPRISEATALVAETIRHEYYYDESAGVSVCLEKALKNADRRLRSSREGAGLTPGSLGVAAAVVRSDELYLATVGPVEAYLVRSARLLIPDRSAPGGLPSEEGRPIEVWRGELGAGDAVLLVSRNLTETVGTEELKSAALTLHPQAAADHLHHLFVAAGGDGSDALIVIEASEQARSHRRAESTTTGAFDRDPPGTPPQPPGPAAGSSGRGARAVGLSLDTLADRIWEAMPRRQPRATAVRPQTSRAETQRRAAIGAMALVIVVFLLGVLVIVVPRGGDTTRIEQVASGDSALTVALDRTNRADNLVATEPDAALDYYREAWAEVVRARNTGLSAPALDDLERRVRAGLDGLYLSRVPVTRRLATLPRGADPVGLVEDLRGGAYYIDRGTSTVARVNTTNGKGADVVREGDAPAAGGTSKIGKPVQIEAGGPDVVVIDDQARPWRWRPSNSAGAGTLNRLTLQGTPTFGEDHGDVAAYSPSTGGYRLYVAEPSRNQIMRYQQTLDGSAFSAPSAYLATPSAEVAEFSQIYVDFDVYALLDNTLRRYRLEKYDGGFALDEPPDAGDVRPGHDYQLVAGASSAASGGRVYLYDALHGRVVGFEKSDGTYLGQWAPGPDEVPMADVRGMYVIPGKSVKKQRDPDTLVWVTPEGIFSSVLAMP